jgi:CDP-diacylglycerol--serine O-phosphatidyltransferase
VTPAVLLLSYGNFEAAFLPGAFILLAAAALRLSYFSTFGLSGSSEYTGLALDNNSILLVFLFAFESTLGTEIFSAVLYVSCLGLAALNVSQIKTPKLSGNPINVRILAVYTLGVTVLYGWQLL